MGDVFSHLIVSCSNHLDIITQPTELLYNPLKTLQIISFDVACTGTLDKKVKRTNCFLCQGQDSVVSCSTLPNHLLRDPFPQLYITTARLKPNSFTIYYAMVLSTHFCKRYNEDSHPHITLLYEYTKRYILTAFFI